MPVTDVTTSPDDLTMTLVGDFSVPVERLWEAFTTPSLLERFWGPPTFPARFTGFDFAPGGRAAYTMTGPRGEKSSGYWEFLSIQEGASFEVLDGFADEDGTPNPAMPSMRLEFHFAGTDGGSRLVTTTHFVSLEEMEKLTEMGMVEGSTLAFGQIDRFLEGLREFAQGKGTQLEILSDTHVRISRLIDGPRDLVWQAHNDPDLMSRWLLGPDGWRVTECVVGAKVGDTHRMRWEPEAGVEGEGFGFEGEVLLLDPPFRAVQTERMIGTPGPSNVNDLTLVEEDGATLVTIVIEYPDVATRDMILATGMIDGMETSYARLDALAQG